MRPELHIVRKAESIVASHIACACDDETDHLYYEDTLGCVRGIAFAFAFQGALIGVVALCWKLFTH
jgi:hypothetical protein